MRQIRTDRRSPAFAMACVERHPRGSGSEPLFCENDMMQPEYLELPEATDPTCSFRVSVTLQGGAMIGKRDICLPSFLKLMSGQQYEMTFDEHPYAITRFDVDIVKRLVKIFARPML